VREGGKRGRMNSKKAKQLPHNPFQQSVVDGGAKGGSWQQNSEEKDGDARS